jgi:hypothetical protein
MGETDMRVHLLSAVLFALCAASVWAAPAVTNQALRLSEKELKAFYPKQVAGLDSIGSIFQSLDTHNRLDVSFSDGKKRSLNVEIRDTGGFTKPFISSHFYLKDPVGSKDINGDAVILINGNRGVAFSWDHCDHVVMAVMDRYEVEIKSWAGLPIDSLKAIALQFEAILKAKAAAGAGPDKGTAPR